MSNALVCSAGEVQCSEEGCCSSFTKAPLPSESRLVFWTMRIDRYTQKMQEGLQAAQDLASQLNNSEITNEHFLSALLDQSDGIARPLLEKIGANVDQLQERLRAELERRPKIHGSAADLRISNELRTVLDSAEKEMSKLKDEFTSAEHYLLALAGVPQSGIPAASGPPGYGRCETGGHGAMRS